MELRDYIIVLELLVIFVDFRGNLYCSLPIFSSQNFCKAVSVILHPNDDIFTCGLIISFSVFRIERGAFLKYHHNFISTEH